jgi:hypothetical protein
MKLLGLTGLSARATSKSLGFGFLALGLGPVALLENGGGAHYGLAGLVGLPRIPVHELLNPTSPGESMRFHGGSDSATGVLGRERSQASSTELAEKFLPKPSRGSPAFGV